MMSFHPLPWHCPKEILLNSSQGHHLGRCWPSPPFLPIPFPPGGPLRLHQRGQSALYTCRLTFMSVHGSSAAEFQANLKKIYTVRSAQGFWAVYNNIPGADEIQVRYSYHLMREDRKPLWEEPYNRRGGTWRIKCQKRDTTKVWREMLVAAIGEQFSDALADGDEICGVTVSVRDREDLVQIWNINADLSEKSTVISRVHRLLPDVDFPAIFYKRHDTHQAFEKGRR
ncbi:eukaryotic translation initiation factor 4E type 3-like isoform X1 [Thrips palmi]|uniref:Eukaryotic translation initiation factor 4E type 3-like isoform X1 n=1 Tax=Thrips palmi TaxID=161013 RepID=A0A6P9AAS2_THRPL|nr:eukaryotic translation initiation factor 4E type 3-like isoform X1 [Thrips palmi]